MRIHPMGEQVRFLVFWLSGYAVKPMKSTPSAVGTTTAPKAMSGAVVIEDGTYAVLAVADIEATASAAASAVRMMRDDDGFVERDDAAPVCCQVLWPASHHSGDTEHEGCCWVCSKAPFTLDRHSP